MAQKIGYPLWMAPYESKTPKKIESLILPQQNYKPLRGHPERISDFLGHFLTYLPTHIRFSPILKTILDR